MGGWLGLRPGWLGLRSGRLGQMGGWTNGRTENLPILQDFVPYRGHCPKTPVLVERRSCDYELSLVEIKHPVFVPSRIDSVGNYSLRWVGVVCPCRHFFQTLWDFFFFFQKLLKQNFLS